MKLYTPKAPGSRPLADFANQMKATYKEKERGRKKASYFLTIHLRQIKFSDLVLFYFRTNRDDCIEVMFF